MHFATQRRKRLFRISLFVLFVLLVLVSLWLFISFTEWRTSRRIFPWSAYSFCGDSTPDALPEFVRIGLYEEFPVPWRLDKLEQVDVPVSLAIAATSRDEFLTLRDNISKMYPQVREIFFWPLLTHEEGYYPGSWSDADGVQRVASEANGLPVLWDLEMPLGRTDLSIEDWWRNRVVIGQWLQSRSVPTHIWRSHVLMGLNPLFLRMMSMHFDPSEYSTVSLHLDLYTADAGQPRDELARILRCGVEAYGERFIPSFGVLNDGEGLEEVFVPVETLKRNLQLAREAGVSEIWLFGVNGLNEGYLAALRETMPLESLSINNN